MRYVEKDISVVGYDKNDIGVATCRFYDNAKTLPYIDINTYYKFLLNKEVKISFVSNNQYKVETYLGEATIDVENDILQSL